MKLYLLRHEDRTQDCSFFGPLTELGLNNACKLIKVLNDNNINMVFSSPFIRTLQTINPYLKEKNLLVNLEYGLSEIHHPDIIPPKSVGISLPQYLAKYYNYNPEYNSLIKPTQIKYPENIINCNNRVKIVLKYIIEKYYKTDLNILLVTHQSPCQTILKIINNNSNYDKGKLILFFDNGWNYKKLN